MRSTVASAKRSPILLLRHASRSFGDLLLFCVTAIELGILIFLTPTFTLTDWIYVLQHIVVLGIAFSRRPPKTQDRSLLSSVAVAVAYGYPYAQIIYLSRIPGTEAWPEAGLVLVTLAAALSLASLITLGRFFGIRPALRGLATSGPYAIVRHPMYLSYMIGDIGYNFQEWNFGSALLTMTGWASLAYRIYAEERMLLQDDRWEKYVARVRYRIIPGVW